MAFSEDMSVFFNAAEFALQASFVPSGGGAAQTANVILDAPTEPVFGGEVLSDDYMMTYPKTSLPGVRKGDVGTVGGVQYRVREVRQAGDGLVKTATLTKV
jgi:hypothetical protein